MSAEDVGLLLAQGMLASGIGETLYAVTIPLFGLNRTFTIYTGVTVIAAFVFGATFIDDDLTVWVRVGSVIVLAGVYLVANYGRPRSAVVADDAVVAAALAATIEAGTHRGALRRFFDAHRFAIGLTLAITLGVIFGSASVLLRHAAEGVRRGRGCQRAHSGRRALRLHRGARPNPAPACGAGRSRAAACPGSCSPASSGPGC